MTRIYIASDQHLLNFLSIDPDLKFDIAVFAGDHGGTAYEAVSMLPCNRPLQEPAIIYVPGNHDYYQSLFQWENHKADIEAHAVGVTFLVRKSIIIQNVNFIGATLWTDFNLNRNVKKAIAECKDQFNDFISISYIERGGIVDFTPKHIIREHRKDLKFIESSLHCKPDNMPTVVVTHHLPSRRSIDPKYINDETNPAFASNLDWLIKKYQPDVWVHGHTHKACDYKIGKTRVICNPVGYDFEYNTGYNPNLVIEL